jgi:hypothetical protein
VDLSTVTLCGREGEGGRQTQRYRDRKVERQGSKSKSLDLLSIRWNKMIWKEKQQRVRRESVRREY